MGKDKAAGIDYLLFFILNVEFGLASETKKELNEVRNDWYANDPSLEL